MDSDLIRKHVLERYILPARARGESTVSVTAGDVQKELGLKNRIAWVCTALRAERFQSENQLRLKSESGPPSGMSTTVKFTFEFAPLDTASANPFWQLRGIAKGLFERPGEWEESIRKDRQEMTDVYDRMRSK